jgi:hypothetical protein
MGLGFICILPLYKMFSQLGLAGQFQLSLYKMYIQLGLACQLRTFKVKRLEDNQTFVSFGRNSVSFEPLVSESIVLHI